MDRGLAFATRTALQNSLLNMYIKNGSLVNARKVFDNMRGGDVFSWNLIIAAYQRHGSPQEAFTLFNKMQKIGVQTNPFTFASVLAASAKIGDLEEGMKLHQRIIQSGIYSDVVVGSTLIDMYAKCGNIHKAREVFDEMPHKNEVSWTTTVAGYAQNGNLERALETFKQMQLAGVKTNSTTYAIVLPSCGKMGAMDLGMEVHQRIIESGCLPDVVLASSLTYMYAKCGSLEKARKLFDKMPRRNMVSWNTIISGYAQNGYLDEALKLFQEMPQKNVVSWTAMIAGYVQNGLVEKALETFKQMLLADVAVVNALIDMYAKCGRIRKARELFDKMFQRVVVSWTVMIAGYAMHGYGKDALELFELMKQSGTRPDHVSFVCVLFACSHAGLVDEGCAYFNDMSSMPTLDHYVCMVDLLARAGYLEEALHFIIKMPIKSAMVLWMCLLSGCRSHKNIGLGVYTATLLFDLIPKNAAPYLLLSDIYAEWGRWVEVRKVKRLIRDMRIKKIPGCSWIEVHKVVHAFCVGDRSHPQTQEIYAKLQRLAEEGHFPYSKHDVEEEEKSFSSSHHSEMLAISFGLLNTSPGKSIRVVKNLRICVDCHTAIKFISKTVDTEIVVRDANRFHNFTQGQCSCGDYW
ncbi:pentatricopeptide repeat-containing protein DOT4, chloroplastic [Cryptomeria japonica]|uniref:pentatricopeptide repeat-containing protein DOT4, chloroplastic n=1 Tax=Cryptomeria japonica TaxID=3369 RepID=UPI0025ACAA2C|nr:pentatricopeptide repeat-containing protein DOT4, chloroplastic [Cryptomeria japonica]